MRGVRRNTLIRAAGAIHRVLQVLRCLLEAGHDVARVGAAKHDFDLRPCLGQPLHQQGQHRPGVFGPVDLSRAQVAHQQLVASEHIQGEKTVVVVVPVKEPADLLSVDPVVGGIEVQDQLPRRCLCRMRRTALPEPRASEPPRPDRPAARTGTGSNHWPGTSRRPPPFAAPGPTAVRRGRSGPRIPAPGRKPVAGASTGPCTGNWPCGVDRPEPAPPASVNPNIRSACRSSTAPPLEVIAPPAKRVSTSRPLQRGKRTSSGLQSVMGKVSFDIGLTN